MSSTEALHAPAEDVLLLQNTPPGYGCPCALHSMGKFEVIAMYLLRHDS